MPIRIRRSRKGDKIKIQRPSEVVNENKMNEQSEIESETTK